MAQIKLITIQIVLMAHYKNVLIQIVHMAYIWENDTIQIKCMFEIVTTWLQFSTEEYGSLLVYCVSINVLWFSRAWFYCKACHEDIKDENLIKKCKCKNCKLNPSASFFIITIFVNFLMIVITSIFVLDLGLIGDTFLYFISFHSKMGRIYCEGDLKFEAWHISLMPGSGQLLFDFCEIKRQLNIFKVQ